MSDWKLPQITAKDVIKLGQLERGEAPTGEWAEKPDLNFSWPSDRVSDDRSVDDRIHNAILAERERCEKAASDACLEQDDAGHTRNSDTWMAACAWIRARITGQEPKFGISGALLIREDEREKAAKIAETAYDATAEGRDWGYCIASKIRESR